ncbi:ABC transporter permease [Arthrobacter mangrovi]|uniref:Glycine/betaine ABC transporter permease n=1 Tax=Arthrobacter mangrovi TaxID=2966350 RepID=A0ABQ5MSS9_9MICC|nr:ABC transporter permease [Arthrobacter mangrovi]GLB67044.1 glycine/betaine ABC transporter permease [Arthrobacter mangrovi]
MNIFAEVTAWFADPAQWSGPAGIPARLAEHLGYTVLTLLIATAIALPIGLYVGHTGKGRIAVVSVASALRALPTLGLLTLFVILLGLGLMPPIWALVILTIPPLLAGSYSGIAAVDRTLVDAARAMGMTEWQVLAKVELPNALPVLLGGVRAAVLQVIATVAVVAYINLGGLGRFLIDGLAVSDPVRMFGGAILIALLALVVDGLLALAQKFAVSPGLADRPHRQRRRTPTVGAVQGGS